MRIEAISKRLVELLRRKEFLQVLEELFSPDAMSIEPDFHPRMKIEGLSNLLRREEEFLKSIKTWHDFEVSDPIVSRDYFSIRMYSRLSMINDQTLDIDELIVYQLSNDKIVKEQFFYEIPKL